MTRIYAQAPMEGKIAPWLTNGKRYLVAWRHARSTCFTITDDQGTRLYATRWTNCPHLNGGNWTRIEEGTEDIPAGMVPWAGGDAAPADWNGGGVLGRHGAWIASDGIHRWTHDGDGADIIAYTPKDATPDPRDTRIAELEVALAVGERFVNACFSAWSCGEPEHRVRTMLDLADEFQATLSKLTGDKS